LSKPEDLIKLLTLGMILDFSGVLFRPRYEKKEKFIEDIPQERMCFRILMKTFAARYATRVGDEWVHPTYLYKISVLAFASALIQYRANINNVKDMVTGDQLKKAVREHLQKDHPDLSPTLDQMLDNKDGWLVWSGPPITIQRRDDAEVVMAAEGMVERREHSQHPIY
ncbi:hypothetical protein FIBSPDRAFT_906259, partial [Athelia psychrophila]